MKISKEAEKEIRDLAASDSMRKDMEKVASQRHNPFFKDGKADIDAYIEFVTQFNEFINHQPKPFKPIIDKVMKL